MRSSAEAMVAPVLPGADHGRGLPVADQLGRPHQRGVLLAPDALGRVLVHGDDLGAGHQLEAAACRPPGRAARPARPAIPLVGGPAGAGHDLAGRPVAAHGVDGHRQAASASARAAARWANSVDLDRLAALVPAAVRAHHVGHLGLVAVRADAAGRAASRQLAAWRLRPLALEVFFLGTAIVVLQDSVADRAVRDRRRLRATPAGAAGGSRSSHEPDRSTSRLAHRGSLGATQCTARCCGRRRSSGTEPRQSSGTGGPAAARA